MFTTKMGYAFLALLLATSLGGFALGQFPLRPSGGKTVAAPQVMQPPAPPTLTPAVAPAPPVVQPQEPKPVKADAGRPGRRREAVIKMPVGTFVKDVEVGEYGSGRLTWTFEDEKVFATVEASAMGVEVRVRVEAECSLSSSGTIYGVVTGVELAHLKVEAGHKLGKLGEYVKFAKLAEPLLNETLTDLPFSYQFRLSGDKLIILNYRALLAGPNPLGKLGGLIGGGDKGVAALSYFQALGMAIEGTYTAGPAEPRDKRKAKPIIGESTKK
jgi:hypothetical protein